jgi:hypothetical protein
MNTIKKILPHCCIILAGIMLTFVIIDKFNPARILIDDDKTKFLLFIFSIVAVIVSVMLIGRQRRDD